MGVDEVALVLLDLLRGVEVVDEPPAEVDRHALGDVRTLGRGPLLQLDEDALVAEIGQLEGVRHRAQRVVPGRDLARRRLVPELLEEPLGELVRKGRAHRIADELLGRAPVEMQVAPALRRSIGTVVKW